MRSDSHYCPGCAIIKPQWQLGLIQKKVDGVTLSSSKFPEFPRVESENSGSLENFEESLASARYHAMPMDIHLGDIVRLRKRHPCGGYEWEVVRLGADIGIKCLTCGRRVLLPRHKFEKSVKKLVGKKNTDQQN